MSHRSERERCKIRIRPIELRIVFPSQTSATKVRGVHLMFDS